MFVWLSLELCVCMHSALMTLCKFCVMSNNNGSLKSWLMILSPMLDLRATSMQQAFLACTSRSHFENISNPKPNDNDESNDGRAIIRTGFLPIANSESSRSHNYLIAIFVQFLLHLYSLFRCTSNEGKWLASRMELPPLGWFILLCRLSLHTDHMALLRTRLTTAFFLLHIISFYMPSRKTEAHFLFQENCQPINFCSKLQT